jgi:hypothetical protein
MLRQLLHEDQDSHEIRKPFVPKPADREIGLFTYWGSLLVERRALRVVYHHLKEQAEKAEHPHPNASFWLSQIYAHVQWIDAEIAAIEDRLAWGVY